MSENTPEIKPDTMTTKTTEYTESTESTKSTQIIWSCVPKQHFNKSTILLIPTQTQDFGPLTPRPSLRFGSTPPHPAFNFGVGLETQSESSHTQSELAVNKRKEQEPIGFEQARKLSKQQILAESSVRAAQAVLTQRTGSGLGTGFGLGTGSGSQVIPAHKIKSLFSTTKPSPVIGPHGRRVVSSLLTTNYILVPSELNFPEVELKVKNACSTLSIEIKNCLLLSRHCRCEYILDNHWIETSFTVELLELSSNPEVVVVEIQRLTGIDVVFEYVFNQLRAVLSGNDLSTVSPFKLPTSTLTILPEMTPEQIEHEWVVCSYYIDNYTPLGLRTITSFANAGIPVPDQIIKRVITFAQLNLALLVLSLQVLTVCIQKSSGALSRELDIPTLVQVSFNALEKGELGRRAGCRLLTVLMDKYNTELFEYLSVERTKWIEIIQKVVTETEWDETRDKATSLLTYLTLTLDSEIDSGPELTG